MEKGEKGRFVNHCQRRAGAGQVGGAPAHGGSAGHQDNTNSPFLCPSFILIVALPRYQPARAAQGEGTMSRWLDEAQLETDSSANKIVRLSTTDMMHKKQLEAINT